MIKSKYMFSEAKAKAKDLAFKAKAMASRTPSLVFSSFSDIAIHTARFAQDRQ